MSLLCGSCPETDAGQFYPYNKSTCKACLLKRNRAWRQANRNQHVDYQKKYQGTTGRSLRSKRFAWLDEVKAKPCEDCGNRFPPECMDFDHINPRTKKFAVSSAAVGGRSVDAVQVEIAKCRLVCANCHRIRTARQQRRRGVR